MRNLLAICALIFFTASQVSATEVSIIKTEFEHSVNGWTVMVTLEHPDTGWSHYADAWRIVDKSGKELGKRVLYHPHEDEQPFTRSLSAVNIPKQTSIVYIEAHCKVDGWSSKRLRVDLTQNKGAGFVVQH